MLTDQMQHHKAMRFYARLVREYGFGDSASTVKKFVRDPEDYLRLKAQEASSNGTGETEATEGPPS